MLRAAGPTRLESEPPACVHGVGVIAQGRSVAERAGETNDRRMLNADLEHIAVLDDVLITRVAIQRSITQQTKQLTVNSQ